MYRKDYDNMGYVMIKDTERASKHMYVSIILQAISIAMMGVSGNLDITSV
jgi:hypothetical protein